MAFVHLHTRTCYSFLTGVPTPEELFVAAKERGFSAIAVTDRANQAGVIDIADASKKTGVKAIFGTELWTAPVVRSVQVPGKKKPEDIVDETGHRLVFLAKNLAGWKNLSRLTTLAHRRMYYVPRVSFEEMETWKEGLICLSGTPSGAAMTPFAERDLSRLLQIFGDDLFLEVVDHGEFDEDKGVSPQETANESTRRWARELGVPIVATNEVAYLNPEDVITLDAMKAIARKGQLFDPRTGRGLVTDQAYLKTEAEMHEMFSAEEIDLSGQIAARCEVQLERKKVFLPTTKPPEDKTDRASQWAWLLQWLPPPISFAGRSTAMPEEDIPVDELYFAWYARTGLLVRFEEDTKFDPSTEEGKGRRAQYQVRLECEIEQIRKMGFPTYLMIVAEFVNWAKDQKIPTGPGRGSAAGSLVVWAIRVTDIDPIHFNLIFERFLNPARVSMPDIDCDFSQDRRGEVIEHVKERYGNDYVGQIAAIQTFQPKKAINDAARLCAMAFDTTENLKKPFGETDDDGKKIDEIWVAVKSSDRIKNAYDNDPLTRTAIDIAMKLEGRPRHTTVHAAGTVIASRRLDEIVGLFQDQETGRSVIGIDMKGAEDLGLVKFDFLGLKTLDVIAYAVELIEKRTKTKIDLTKIPLDDENVLRMLSKADAKGVFQVESQGMKRLIRDLKPSSIEDIIAALALFRPGPLKSGMVDDFVERKHGRKEVVHLHPTLKTVLEKTYGVIVYQEQVMQIAQVMSGYSLADADLLRRAMGKKKPEEMAKQKKSFIEGAEKNGVDPKKANEVFDLVDYFSGYGFNRSHSAAYGLITWQTAWLKSYHRAEFMAAAMSWEKSGSDEVAAMMIDVISSGIALAGPDIDDSTSRFDVITKDDKPVVRFGIGSLKGLGVKAQTKILAERALHGPFGSLDAFLQRRDPRAINKRICEILSEAGAFDRFEVPRWEVHQKLAKPPSKRKKKVEVVEETPRTLEELVLFRKKYKAKPPWTFSEKLRLEQRVLGFWVTGHPLDRYAEMSQILPSATSRSLLNARRDEPVSLACVPIAMARKRTHEKRYVTFVTFSDRNGVFDAILFHEASERHRAKLELREPVLIYGVWNRGTVRVDEIVLLSEMRRKMARLVQINVMEKNATPERLTGMLEILEKYPGKVPVRLRATKKSRKGAGMVMTEETVDPAEMLFQELELWADDPFIGQILPKSAR